MLNIFFILAFTALIIIGTHSTPKQPVSFQRPEYPEKLTVGDLSYTKTYERSDSTTLEVVYCLDNLCS